MAIEATVSGDLGSDRVHVSSDCSPVVAVRVVGPALVRAGLEELLAATGRFEVLDTGAADVLVSADDAISGSRDQAVVVVGAGAQADLSWDADPSELTIKIIDAVRNGSPVSSRPVASDDLLVGALTVREREVLDALASGLGSAAIGERLNISTNTVRTHVQNVLGKLGAATRLEAVAIARRAGTAQR